MPLDPQMENIMQLVEQVEQLPPEVLDLVAKRKSQAEKANKKGSEEQMEEVSQLYDLMQKFKLTEPIQPPTPMQNPAEQSMGLPLGEVDPGLMI